VTSSVSYLAIARPDIQPRGLATEIQRSVSPTPERLLGTRELEP
jgi:hypothetical protein